MRVGASVPTLGGALTRSVEDYLKAIYRLSPQGRAAYLAKRQEAKEQKVNLVEIDLLRGGRPLIEMGGRRTHEEAAVAAARIAYLCGFGTRRTLYRAFRRGTSMSPDEYRRKKNEAGR